MESRGKFISIEGGEGVGKSLFIRNLKVELDRLSVAAIFSREPGGTEMADRLRSLFIAPPENEPFTVEAEFLVLSAARSQHTYYKIMPNLKKGNWVVCDRYSDSSLVYQGFCGGLDSGFIESVTEKSTYGIKPDLTFVLDCDVEIAIARVMNRAADQEDGAKRYDDAGRDLYQKLRDGFLRLAKEAPGRVVVLDASQTPEKVLKDAMDEIRRRFNV